MPSRKVSVFIYQYPKDFHSSFSLRRLFEIKEELIYQEKYMSHRTLYELLQMHVEHTMDYASLLDEQHWYRVVIRDCDDRLSMSFLA